MTFTERGIVISRRKALQLPFVVSRDIGNLNALSNASKAAEFVRQHPDEAKAVTQKFLQALMEICRGTLKPKTPEVFRDRPEDAELSIRDKAINAVTDILQLHTETILRMRLDPLAAIEPLADHLVAGSRTGIFHGSIVVVNQLTPSFNVYTLIDEPPLGSSSRMNRDSYKNPDTPSRLHAKETHDFFKADMDLWGKGPFMTHFMIRPVEGGIPNKQLRALKEQGEFEGVVYYVGELLPVR